MSGDKKNNFWMTLNLLVGIGWKKNLMEDVEDWLESVEAKRNLWTPETSSGTKSSSKSNSNSSRASTRSSNYDRKNHFILQLPKVECSFRHPKIRSRLERLMGSNLVLLTNRQYMRKLNDRILEDYIQSMNKRIADREAAERNREKELVLTGIIPLDNAPAEMASHPILQINNYCQKLIAERRAKIKVPKVVIPLLLYLDDTPDPPAGLSIVEGHVFRKPDNPICVPPETHLAYTDEEDVQRGYMYTHSEFEKKQKYESDQVKELANVQTVEQMYNLADQIIGPLKTIKTTVIEEDSGAPKG